MDAPHNQQHFVGGAGAAPLIEGGSRSVVASTGGNGCIRQATHVMGEHHQRRGNVSPIASQQSPLQVIERSTESVDSWIQDELRAATRLVWERHTGKRLARMFMVPLATANFWLARRFPAARYDELAAGLLVDMDRQDRERAGTRLRLRRIREICDGTNAAKIRSLLGCAGDDDGQQSA